MIEAWKKALVLAPHTDDGELGCGGTMARLVEGGCEVRYVAFSIATRSLPPGFEPDTLAREVREATAELGIPEDRLTVHDFDVRTFPDRRQDILTPTVIDEDTLIGYLIGEAEREGVDLVDDVDAVAVVEAHLAYLDAIGAVGPPAAGDDIADLGPPR